MGCDQSQQNSKASTTGSQLITPRPSIQEQKSDEPNMQAIPCDDDTLYQKFWTGNWDGSEIGLWYHMQLIKMVIKKEKGNRMTLTVDDETYEIGKTNDDWKDIHFNNGTVSLRHEPRNWDLVVGGAGNALTDKFYCRINGVRNDELELACKAKADLPDLLRSETLPIYNDVISREAFSFFALAKDPVDQKEKHLKHWVTVEHNSNLQTIVAQFGEKKETYHEKPFGDTSAFPISLVDPKTGIKALIGMNSESGTFTLTLDNKPFKSYMYLDPTYSADENTAVSFGVNLRVNGNIVKHGGFEWSIATLYHLLYQANGDTPMTKLMIKQIQCNTAVANETLALLGQQPHDPENGLKEVHLEYWEYIKEALDLSAMEGLISMCGGLQRLRMIHMFQVADETRHSLALLAAAMIDKAGTALIELNVEQICCGYEGGAAIFKALNEGGASDLVLFNCFNNGDWFKDHEDNVDHLVEIFARQTKLQTVDIRDLHLNQEASDRVITALAESESLDSFKVIKLGKAGDFSSSAAEEHLDTLREKGVKIEI